MDTEDAVADAQSVARAVQPLLFFVARAHEPAAPTLRDHVMQKCAEACKPAEAVQASITVDWTKDLWLCTCRPDQSLARPET